MIQIILYLVSIISLISAMFCLFMIFRSISVYNIRTKYLKEAKKLVTEDDPKTLNAKYLIKKLSKVKKIMKQYNDLPPYEEMTIKFWIPLSRYKYKHEPEELR